jgi:anti-sigma B factor antagonist
MDGLSIHVADGSPPVLQVGGELDLATAGQLATALQQALAADATVVVDMAEVTFVDASGLRVILQAAESLDGAGPLTLLHAPRVAWLLKVVGLEGISTIDLATEDRHGG